MKPFTPAEVDAFHSGRQKYLRLVFSDGTIIENPDIANESMSFSQSLCDETQLTFGRCSSACFKITLLGVAQRYAGLTVDVTISAVGVDNITYTRTIGTFKVVSDTATSNKLQRNLECYDALYDILPADYAEWYNQLSFPMTKVEWIRSVFSNSKFSLALQKPLINVIDESYMFFDDIEEAISYAIRSQKMEECVENGLRIILSVYNRFSERTDLGDEKAFMEYGADTQSIAMIELFEKVKEYSEQPCAAFLQFIMEEWLIEQHFITAFGKMLQGRDGFYYELIDGKYIRKNYFYIDFQGIRLTSLAQVMRDLDIL